MAPVDGARGPIAIHRERVEPRSDVRFAPDSGERQDKLAKDRR
jgi:hypothetical protein